MNAALLKKMREMGLSIDQAIELAEAWEEGSARPVPELSPAAMRTRKWREKNKAVPAGAERHDERHGDGHGDASPGDEPLSLPLSPQTPLTPTHTRECNTTRARRDAEFERFWADYPRKVGKGDARKAFDKAVRKIGDDAAPVLSGALERAKAAWTDAQFIPHPATWLNREGWEDQPLEHTPVAVEPRRAHGTDAQPSAKQVARHANYERAFAGAQAAARSRNVG